MVITQDQANAKAAFLAFIATAVTAGGFAIDPSSMVITLDMKQNLRAKGNVLNVDLSQINPAIKPAPPVIAKFPMSWDMNGVAQNQAFNLVQIVDNTATVAPATPPASS